MIINGEKLIIDNKKQKNCHLPDGWEIKKLGEVCKFTNG